VLITFVVLYLAVTIGIGLLAARRVHNAKDYMVAGRSLPLYMNVATVFATWFGAETVLSVSATFAKDGLGRHPRRPVRRQPVPGDRGAAVRAAVLPHEPADHRRLLQAALRQGRRGADQRGHRAVLPGLDVGADDGARPGHPRAVRWRARTRTRPS
jgi:hypothetical protein